MARQNRWLAALYACAVGCIAVKVFFALPLLIASAVWTLQNRVTVRYLLPLLAPVLVYAATWIGGDSARNHLLTFESTGWFSAHGWGALLFYSDASVQQVVRTIAGVLGPLASVGALALGLSVDRTASPQARLARGTTAGLLGLFSFHYLFNPEYLLFLVPFALPLVRVQHRPWLSLALCVPWATKFFYAAAHAKRHGRGGLNGSLARTLDAWSPVSTEALHACSAAFVSLLLLGGLALVLSKKGATQEG